MGKLALRGCSLLNVVLLVLLFDFLVALWVVACFACHTRYIQKSCENKKESVHKSTLWESIMLNKKASNCRPQK